MSSLVLANARIFDGHSAECAEGQSVLVADGVIQEVSGSALKGARVIDCGGRTLMPGLIDAHMHAYASDVNVQRIEDVGEPYRTAHAIRILCYQLDCGFTIANSVSSQGRQAFTSPVVGLSWMRLLPRGSHLKCFTALVT